MDEPVQPPTILVVQNDPDKSAGRIGAALEAEGARLDVRFSRDELPDVAAFDGLIVLPGLADPDDDDPALDRIRATITRAIDEAIPVLGICLGGQLLAQVLGGSTYACTPEVGFHDVRTTSAASGDPLFRGAPATYPSFHAHAYAFQPPEDATILLENDTCVQACRLGEAWAIQCHPEPDVGWVDGLARALRDDPDGVARRTAAFFRQHGVDPAQLERDARAADASATVVASSIAAGFASRLAAARTG